VKYKVIEKVPAS